MLAGIPVMALWGFAGPATQAMMTSQLEAHEQGRLQGGLCRLCCCCGCGSGRLHLLEAGLQEIGRAHV